MANTNFGSGPADQDQSDQWARDHAKSEAERLGDGDGPDPFLAAVQVTRMPITITNPRLPDNPMVFVNDAFCKLTGYEHDEIIGRNCRFLQGPDTDPATVATIRDAVRAEQRFEIDIRNYRKDGTPFWNRLLVAPINDSEGKVCWFFASQVDVTLERERLPGLETYNAALLAQLSDRLRAQEDSEARLQAAARAGGMGIWELNLRDRRLTASRIYKENFGADPEAAFSLTDMEEAIHPLDRERVRTARQHSIASGEDFQVQFRTRPQGAGPDWQADGPGHGLHRWIEARARIERDAGGAPSLLAGVSFDITQRRQTEERNRALAELDNHFRELDDPTDLAYAAAELLGRTLGVSRAGYGTIDPEAETIDIERDWNAPGISSLAGRLHFRNFGSYIDDLKTGETVVIADAESDSRTRSTAGALKAISAQAFINMPVTEQEGLVALLYLNHATARQWPADELAFVREVAQRTRMVVERRRAEQALRRLAASLEEQVTARTTELMETEAALRQSQKMEAVGQLTGGLAHDFNNLLTGITGSLEMLRNRVAQGRTAEIDRYLVAAEGAANRAAALTHRLLAFSRRQTLSPKATDVNLLIAGMQDLIRQTAGPGVQLEVTEGDGLWSTKVDPSQLENALLNLCINARDAMPDGGRITIETANTWIDRRTGELRDMAAGQYVALCVSDTGSGMAPEIVAKAFDPFFTTKPLGQGTGLGLSMIYGFARQSGGQVRIYSEVGQGTRVCLYLPRHAGTEEAAADLPANGGDAGTRAAPTAATILVVDDEPTIRMLITELLHELGYATMEAVDGPSGLDVLETAAEIDLLITDVGLPGLNGRQLADAGRARRPGLKVLFVTGYAENAVIDHGHLEPGMHVLTKPFTLERIGATVSDLLT